MSTSDFLAELTSSKWPVSRVSLFGRALEQMSTILVETRHPPPSLAVIITINVVADCSVVMQGYQQQDNAVLTPSSQSSPPLLHLLLRLVSLVYTSPTESAAFYADILLVLFPPSTVEHVNAQLRHSHSSTSLPPKNILGTSAAPAVPRKDRTSTTSPSKVGLQHDVGSKPDVELFDPHIAVHARALVFNETKDYYSAIALVRDLVQPSTTGGSSQKSKRMDDPSTSTSTSGWTAVPIGKDKKKSETISADGRKHHGCLACAQILALACQAVGRFEEGREVLESAMEQQAKCATLSEANDEGNPRFRLFQWYGWLTDSCTSRAGFTLPLLQPPSVKASIQLARLTHRANRFPQEPIDQSRPVDEDRQPTNTGSNSRRSSAAKGSAAWYYLEALKDDAWLWEAWTGLCDSGSS
jgi:hypothetical protein